MLQVIKTFKYISVYLNLSQTLTTKNHNRFKNLENIYYIKQDRKYPLNQDLTKSIIILELDTQNYIYIDIHQIIIENVCNKMF